MAKKNPAAVELAALRMVKMTPEERSQVAAMGGKARAKPTRCPRCGLLLPTARAAWLHCRKPRKASDAKGEAVAKKRR